MDNHLPSVGDALGSVPVLQNQNIPGDCYLEERGRGLLGMWIPESHRDLRISTLDIHVSPFQVEDRITATLMV